MISAGSLASDGNSACGDWVTYKDEKCFKMIKSVMPESDAIESCKKKYESKLASIKTKDESDFMTNYLKTQSIADNVWIGIKKFNNTFKSFDETDLEFNNWANGRPHTNKPGYNCVEISTIDESYGQWLDENCEKNNAVLCEKIQPWSNAKIQSVLVETKRQLINEMNEKFKEMQRGAIPIGFIYFQLANQSEPRKLWPNTEWKSVTSQYSGLFFRAEGQDSASFGQIQEQQTQSFEVESEKYVGKQDSLGPIKIEASFNALPIWTGNRPDAGGKSLGLKIKHNQEEIRPRNQAIRIWQRIK